MPVCTVMRSKRLEVAASHAPNPHRSALAMLSDGHTTKTLLALAHIAWAIVHQGTLFPSHNCALQTECINVRFQSCAADIFGVIAQPKTCKISPSHSPYLSVDLSLSPSLRCERTAAQQPRHLELQHRPKPAKVPGLASTAP